MANGIDALHLLQEAVRPALVNMGPAYATVSAEQIVMGTAALESRLIWLRQHGKGPARGLWQMEPPTFYDLIARCPFSLLANVLGMSTVKTATQVYVNEICWNLRLGAAMCRLKYRDDPHPLPEPGDVHGMEVIHKRCYNSVLGKTKPGEFTRAWADLIAPRYNEMWP